MLSVSPWVFLCYSSRPRVVIFVAERVLRLSEAEESLQNCKCPLLLSLFSFLRDVVMNMSFYNEYLVYLIQSFVLNDDQCFNLICIILSLLVLPFINSLFMSPLHGPSWESCPLKKHKPRALLYSQVFSVVIAKKIP